MNLEMDEKQLQNLQFLLTDLLSGDEDILARADYKALRPETIQTALTFLLENPNLDDSQRSYLFMNSWRVNFRDNPPTPEEFITEKYLGPAAKHTYDRVKTTFVEFMDPTKPYRDLILYPHIGWGKSYLSTLINLYVGTHLSLMRNPYRFFGLNPATILTQLLVSYSLKKSSELLLEPMIAILESSPYFEKVKTRDGMIKRDQDFERQSKIDRIYWTTAVPTSAVQMSNGANFKLVSNVQNLLGLSVVSAVLSELAFFREAGKTDDYIMRIYNDTKGRIDSRMKGNYYGRSILDSSPNTLDSPIDDYIVNHARKNPINFVVDGSVWKWAPNDYDLTKTFRVYVGGKGQPPRILFANEDLSDIAPNKIIDVPAEFRQRFEDDLYKSLKDFAGIPAGSADNLIYNYQKIEDIFNPNMRSLYTHIGAKVEDEPMGLIWKQIEPLFFRQRAGRTEFWYKPHLPRVISIDQSVAQDVSSVAMAHVERKQGSEELIFIVDAIIPIAPMGSRINLDAIKFFIQDLRDKGNIDITHISFDQYQSESSIQYLRSRDFEVEKVSVDLTTDPYYHLMSLIETNRIVAGRNLHFKNNLKSLKIVKRERGGKGGKVSYKVDHEDSQKTILTGPTDWDKSLIGFFAKDASDSVTAACELLRRYHSRAYEEWDPEVIAKLADNSLEKEEAQRKTLDFLSKMGLS
jgi:hypothetical protein